MAFAAGSNGASRLNRHWGTGTRCSRPGATTPSGNTALVTPRQFPAAVIRGLMFGNHERALRKTEHLALLNPRGELRIERRTAMAAFSFDRVAVFLKRYLIGLVPALIPASSSIEAATPDQKHDDDDDEKSCHIHDGVSFGRTVGNLISPTSGRTWLLIGAGAAPDYFFKASRIASLTPPTAF